LHPINSIYTAVYTILLMKQYR